MADGDAGGGDDTTVAVAGADEGGLGGLGGEMVGAGGGHRGGVEGHDGASNVLKYLSMSFLATVSSIDFYKILVNWHMVIFPRRFVVPIHHLV